jgi:hypothetical protein
VNSTDAPGTGDESVLRTVAAIGTVEFFVKLPSGASGGSAGATVQRIAHTASKLRGWMRLMTGAS